MEVSLKKLKYSRNKRSSQKHGSCLSVYIWDGQSEKSKQRLLLIRISKSDSGGEEIRYALCNAKKGQFSSKEIAQMQAQRYFVERSFQESKSNISMSDYQVRSW